MRALSIRQPYAELILRGIKPIEFRSRPTKRIGERFYIYASQQWAEGKLFLEGCRVEPQIPSSKSQSNPNDQIPNPKLHVPVIGDNIEVPTEGPQPWMLIAEAARGETRVPPVVFVLENSHGRDAHDTFSKLSNGGWVRPPVMLHWRPATLYRWHRSQDQRRYARQSRLIEK